MCIPSLQSLCISSIEEQKCENSNNFNYEELHNKEFHFTSTSVKKEVISLRLKRLHNRLEDIVCSNNCLIVGDVQSGKTRMIISSCWFNQYIDNMSTVVVLRNITYDIFQLKQRVDEFNKMFIQDKNFYIRFVYCKDIDSIPKNPTIVAALANPYQTGKIIKLFFGMKNLETKGIFEKGSDKFYLVNEKDYQKFDDKGILGFGKRMDIYTNINGLLQVSRKIKQNKMYDLFTPNSLPREKYCLIIDEVDNTKKSINSISKLEIPLDKIKEFAHKMYGFTATPINSIVNDNFSRLVKMDIVENYIGVDKVDISIIEDNLGIYDLDSVYTKFMSKSHGIMLHNTTIYTLDHMNIAYDLKSKYKGLVTMSHNALGVTVYTDVEDYSNYLTKRELLKYKRKKNSIGYVHNFKKFSFSKVLQIIKDHNNSEDIHISIVSRIIASRGMSYVSEDYGWHVTDEILLDINGTADSLLQAMRCCGIWSENNSITLWTTKKIGSDLTNYHSFIRFVIEKMDDNIDEKLQDKIQKIKFPFYTNRLYNTTNLKKYKFIKKDNIYEFKIIDKE